MSVRNFIKPQRGYSLLGTLVSVAIMGIVVLGMVSTFQYQNREVKALNEKMSALSLEKALIAALANGSVCNFQLTNAGPWITSTVPVTFDANNLTGAAPPVISLQKILASATSDAPAIAEVNTLASLNSNSAFIKAIQIMGITGPSTGNVFKAFLQVVFDSDKMIRSIQPISIQQTIFTSGMGNIKTITGCLSETPASGGDWQCSTLFDGPKLSPTCVRTSDGTTCIVRDEGSWCEEGDSSWPGGGPWQCSAINTHAGGGDGAGQRSGTICVRTSDGTICRNSIGSGRDWSCGPPASRCFKTNGTGVSAVTVETPCPWSN